MREKWEQLNPRERQLVQIGGVVLLVFVLLWFGVRPSLNAITRLQKQVTTEQELLAWMTPQAEKIVELRQHKTGVQKINPTQLLPTIQDELHAANLTKGLEQISLASDDEVSLSFNEVPFDVFISWYSDMSDRYGISATNLVVTGLPKVGEVRIEARLHR